MTSLNDKLITAFAKAGPWALLTLLLLSVIVFEVRPALASLKAEHSEMRAEVNTTLKEVRDAVRRSAYLEFRNCINTAQNVEQSQRCAYEEP